MAGARSGSTPRRSASHARPQRQLRRKKPKAQPVVVTHSADPDAAGYSRIGDHRDDNGDAPGGVSQPKVAWGYEATLAISGSMILTRPHCFRSLAVGTAVLHKPGHDVGRNGVRALAQVSAFRASRAGPWRLTGPIQTPSPRIFSSQFEPSATGRSMTTRSTNWASCPSSQGFVQIEGLALPLDPTAADRRHHRLPSEPNRRGHLPGPGSRSVGGTGSRRKGKPDSEGHIRLACPAASPWPMARCDLKPASMNNKTRGRVRDSAQG